MAHRLGTFRGLIQNIKQTLSVRSAKEILVGTDLEGNKYFERPAVPSKGVKRVRRVEPVSTDQFTVPKVPVEWMTWLQARREDPPSEQEMDKNYMNMMKTLHRAGEVDKHYENQRKNEPIDKQTAPSSARREYPVYEDYETYQTEFHEKHKTNKPDR